MSANRRTGVEWAAETLLAKTNPPLARRSHVEDVFWVALDWGTYRTLTHERGLSPDAFEAWLRSYYRGMLGA